MKTDIDAKKADFGIYLNMIYVRDANNKGAGLSLYPCSLISVSG